MDTLKTPSNEKEDELQQQWEGNGVKSPPKDPDLVGPLLTPEEVKTLMRREGDQRITRYLLEAPGNDKFNKKRLILLYLYACGYEKKSSQADRVPRLLEFIQDDETIERMLRVISVEPAKPTVTIKFWKMCQLALIQYSRLVGAETVFGRDMPCNGMPFVCRIQHSGNCYMQAAFALVGYRVMSCPGMSIDMAWFVRRLPHEKLRSRVVEDQGGSSKEFLFSLVDDALVRSLGRDVSRLRKARILINQLKASGPCLLCRFATGKHFQTDKAFSEMNTTSSAIRQFDIGEDTNAWLSIGTPTPPDVQTVEDLQACYHSADDESAHQLASVSYDSDVGSASGSDIEIERDINDSNECHGTYQEKPGKRPRTETQEEEVDDLHAMLIIGFRVQDEGGDKEKIWFLLQNSWEDMPLVEVSAAYLSYHIEKKHGGYAFITEPLQAFPQGYQITQGLVQESHFMDGGDNKKSQVLRLERDL
jgi:hypothetical protein